jgi:hypothetical protein
VPKAPFMEYLGPTLLVTVSKALAECVQAESSRPLHFVGQLLMREAQVHFQIDDPGEIKVQADAVS